ncbi:MAG TPA: CapA family protein [Clostridiaceae bacterium]|nr:CapA family protein [Clostridiaceae bacterium]
MDNTSKITKSTEFSPQYSRHFRLLRGFVVALVLTGVFFAVACSRHLSANQESRITAPTILTSQDPLASVDPATPTPTPTSTPTPTPTPTPTAKSIVVSFIGDTTLGQNRGVASADFSFASVVADDYAYPFSKAVPFLETDHLTLANFEGTLTTATAYQDKEFTFKGPLEYVEILKLGSIEAVNLANNHTYDYGESGLKETRSTLDDAGIYWSDSANYAVYEVDGVKIGMAGFTFPWQMEPIYKAIDSLRESGCEIVIISVHTGVERMYEPESVAVNMAHDIIDYGADIYVGHHPHRLQPIEFYNGKYILYSLSNFVFGGQPWLTDPDTAIIQCTFTVDEGQLLDSRLKVIPFSMTSTFPGNDYCAEPYEVGSEEYERVMLKLRWSEAPE